MPITVSGAKVQREIYINQKLETSIKEMMDDIDEQLVKSPVQNPSTGSITVTIFKDKPYAKKELKALMASRLASDIDLLDKIKSVIKENYLLAGWKITILGFPSISLTPVTKE